MAFSIRNIFGSNPDDPTPSDTSHSQETPAAAPVPNAGFLFKTASNSMGTAPNTMSQKPSQPASHSALVLADVIASIPQELRHPAFQDLQAPLSLPPSVLREHLGRGKAALPLAEIYRALPEAFTQAVDDQDPRSVAVPPMKLVSLIAQIQTAGNPAQEGTSAGFLPKTSLPGGSQASGSVESPPQVTSSFSHLPPPHRSESNPFNTLPRRKVEPTSEVSASVSEEKSSPFSKVERAVAKSPFSPVAPSEAPPINTVPAPAASTPASEPSPPPSQVSEPQLETKPLPMASPFTAVQATSPAPTVASQMAQGAVSCPTATSPFERVKALTTPARPDASAQSVSEEPTIGLELKQLLKLVSPQDLGFDAQSLPSEVQAKIPVSVLRSKLHQSTPSLSLGELSQYVRSDLSGLLQSGNAGTQVELPMNQLYHQLAQQENAASAATKGVELVSSKPEANSALEAFPSLPGLEQRLNPEPQASPDSIEAMPTFEPAPEIVPQTVSNVAASVKPSPEPTSSLLRQLVDSTPPAVAPTSLTAPTSFPEAPPAAPVQAPAPAPMITPPVADSLDLAQTRTISKSRGDQLIWRVLFGVKQEVDAAGVLELTRQQLGVPAIAVIQGGSVTLQNVEASEAAKQFLAQAPKICEHLQPLVQLTGIQDAETFSIKHHDYVNTFSAQDRYTLAVMHPPVADETALKEKITLIARELNALLGA